MSWSYPATCKDANSSDPRITPVACCPRWSRRNSSGGARGLESQNHTRIGVVLAGDLFARESGRGGVVTLCRPCGHLPSGSGGYLPWAAITMMSEAGRSRGIPGTNYGTYPDCIFSIATVSNWAVFGRAA